MNASRMNKLIRLFPVISAAVVVTGLLSTFACAENQSSRAPDELAKIQRLLANKNFVQSVGCENHERCRVIFEELKQRRAKILEPIAQGAEANFPAYLAIQSRCPTFDFEHGDVDGVPATGHDHFALYKYQAHEQMKTEAINVFAVARYVSTAGRSGEGRFFVFDPDKCKIISSVPMNKGLGVPNTSEESVNDVAEVNGHLCIILIYPIHGYTTTTEGAPIAMPWYELDIWSFTEHPLQLTGLSTFIYKSRAGGN